MTSYQRCKRRADEAEKLLAIVRRNALALALEVHRLEDQAATRPANIARRVLGLDPCPPAQFRLRSVQ